MSKHTPTPWDVQPFGDGEDGIGIVGLRTNAGVPYQSPTNGLVAWATLHPTEIDADDPARAQANAALIVKAVNSHAMLVKALEDIKAATLNGRVCDDVAWFGPGETLHDFCESILDRVGGSLK